MQLNKKKYIYIYICSRSEDLLNMVNSNLNKRESGKRCNGPK